MKTVFLLRYSQLTQSNMMESVKAFVNRTGIDSKALQAAVHKEGGLELSLYKAEEIEQISQGAIYLYKTGKISDVEFVERMNRTMAIDLSMETFKECWNAMCTVQPETLAFLRQVESLQKKHGFGIHVMGNTNSMQVNYVNEQFTALGLELGITYTLSFVAGVLEPAPPKTTDDGWTDVNIIDLRDTKSEADILTEFNKLSTVASCSKAPKRKLSLA